jgi:hypothetical protein
MLLAVLGHSSRAPLVGSVFAVLALLLAWRIFSAGVYLDTDAVKVVGFIRSWRVAWPDVERFDLRREGRRNVAVLVRTREHLPVPILALSGGSGVQRWVDELNERLTEWRSAGPRLAGASVQSPE